MSTVKSSLALVFATLFWAGNYVVGHLAVQAMSPLDLTWWRWLLASVPLLVLAQVVEKPDWRAVARHWPRLLLLAALGLAGYTLLLYAALRYTSPQSAALINAANPAVMVVLAAVLLRERMGWRGILGLVVSLFGVLLVITDGALASVFTLEFNAGDLLMLGAIVVWSLYTILGRGLKVPPITATAVQSTMIAVPLAPFALAGGATWPAEAPIAWALVYIVVFPSIGSYVLWNLALKRIPAGRAGLFLNLITVFTVVIAVALGEVLTLAQLLGGLIVFAGVALSSLRPAGRPAAATAAPTDVSPPLAGATKP